MFSVYEGEFGVFLPALKPVEVKHDENKDVYLLINKLYAVRLCGMWFLSG